MMKRPITATIGARFRDGLAGVARGLAGGALRLVELLFEWQERARQRETLGKLSDYMLHDIGISRADAEREVDKPFWRP